MTILEINLLIQRDWINRPSTETEQEQAMLNQRRRKAWARYYKNQMKAGLEPDPLWKPGWDRPNSVTA